MSNQLPLRTEQASTIGKDVVKLLIREPVREAVQEALREEQIRGQASTGQPSLSEDQPSEDGGRGIPVKSLLAIVGLVGVILLVRRMRSDDSTGTIAGDTTGHHQSETTRPTGRDNPSHMSEDGD